MTLPHPLRVLLALSLLAFAGTLSASETENFGIRVLPAPGKVEIDGKIDDWDLSGGVFACGELEHLRDQYGVWFHAMYDAENVYLLARWIDPTPMNNPESRGGHGWNGDCLQARFVMFPGAPEKTTTWWTLWRDAQGKSVADRGWPGPKNGATQDNEVEALDFPEEKGFKQAFLVNPDGKGYVQEVCIPWKLLSASGKVPQAGDKFKFTIEPNFTAGGFGRITIKDIFDSNAGPIDRIFTFRAYKCWGWATLESKGAVEPNPVRLADGRTFPVTLQKGVPHVDWTGLIRKFEWPGFKEISFDAPADGFVSLNILNSDGEVVRHLLNCDERSQGAHALKWDGLTDPTYRTPGVPVPPGDYTWQAIEHPEAKITLRGYASYGGRAPWQSRPGDYWLGDHGVPSAVIADNDRIYLACNGAEGGHHLVATDFQGKWQWSLQNTTGSGDPEYIAADGGAVLVLHSQNGRASPLISRVDSKLGTYIPWKDRRTHILTANDIWETAGTENAPLSFTGIGARDGKIYLTAGAANKSPAQLFVVLDGQSGKLIKTWPLPMGGPIHAVSANQVDVICGSDVVAIDPETGKTRTIQANLNNARGLTTDKDGNLYVSVWEPQMQVLVFDAAGKELKRVGRDGGRRKIGAWQPDGMFQPSGLAVDKENKLWVMEHYAHPKRVSVWNLNDGSFVKDFYGSAHYGAGGGAINPRDPNLMVGEGCEWRLDPATGKSVCLGTFDDAFHEFATYREANNRLFLFTNTARHGTGAIQIWERLGDADFKLAALIRNDTGDGQTTLWVDANGDGQQQPEELSKHDGIFYFLGANCWSMNVGPDLTLYGFDTKDKKLKALPIQGLTAGGAPNYDFKNLKDLPAEMSKGYVPDNSCALPSADNKTILLNITDRTHPAKNLWRCFDLETGKLRWSYPNPYFHVHGSHNAPAPEMGLFRGAFGTVGAFTLPGAGPVWIINGNLGEWYTLTSSGFFLSRVFNGNIFDMVWPEEPVPGADLTNAPAGCGGEDFGGSVAQGHDGKIYIQSGKLGIWNSELTGLEKTVAIPGGKLTLNDDDTKQAAALRERALQSGVAGSKLNVKNATITFTGDFNRDFKDCQPVDYKKSEDGRVRTALAHDAETLYIGWEVHDATPWINGAKDISQMYAGGDTVDLQLGSDPGADPQRGKAVKGDIRLSIGNFQGQPTAVLYKFVSDQKSPRTFSSGVIANYQVDFVEALAAAKITIKQGKDWYVVEAAVPLSSLGIKLTPKLSLRGDVGATHGDPSGVRTKLRTYWCNQSTGLVDDVVFELQVTPKNWGEFVFE